MYSIVKNAVIVSACVATAGAASAAEVWSDDFNYGTGALTDETGYNAAGWVTGGTFGTGYGITNAQRLWGNSGNGMVPQRAHTGHILAAGDDIDVIVDVDRTGAYNYSVEIFAWDGVTATSLGSSTITNDATISATATGAHVGQELVFDFQHVTTWGETNSIAVDVTPIPEPGSLALMGLGGLLVARRRRA